MGGRKTKGRDCLSITFSCQNDAGSRARNCLVLRKSRSSENLKVSTIKRRLRDDWVRVTGKVTNEIENQTRLNTDLKLRANFTYSTSTETNLFGLFIERQRAGKTAKPAQCKMFSS